MTTKEEKLKYLKEYLEGVLFYGLSQDQIDKLPSIQAMRDMYAILEENFILNGKKKNMLSKEDKVLAGSIFDENIWRFTQQQIGGTTTLLARNPKNNDFSSMMGLEQQQQQDTTTYSAAARTRLTEYDDAKQKPSNRCKKSMR